MAIYQKQAFPVDNHLPEKQMAELGDVKKFYTLKQMEELREHAYQLGIKHEQQTNPKHNLGTMDCNCDHDVEKLYNANGDYKGDYCKICKGVY